MAREISIVESIRQELRILDHQRAELGSRKIVGVEIERTRESIAEARINLGFMVEDDPERFRAALDQLAPDERKSVLRETLVTPGGTVEDLLGVVA